MSEKKFDEILSCKNKVHNNSQREEIKMQMHKEYAMQWCSYDINGNPKWWTLTEWCKNLEIVKAQWEKFANRNDPCNPDLGHRLVERMVSDPKVVEGDLG